MSEVIRYAAAACQTDLANPPDRAHMRENTDRMLSMIDSAVAGKAPFLPVRLVVFPEFAHARNLRLIDEAKCRMRLQARSKGIPCSLLPERWCA